MAIEIPLKTKKYLKNIFAKKRGQLWESNLRRSSAGVEKKKYFGRKTGGQIVGHCSSRTISLTLLKVVAIILSGLGP